MCSKENNIELKILMYALILFYVSKHQNYDMCIWWMMHSDDALGEVAGIRVLMIMWYFIFSKTEKLEKKCITMLTSV